MRLTAQQEYGLRCMVQMARLDCDGNLVRIAEIAQREDLSVPYVAKLMRILRQEGLVTSVRGVKGGYVLARPSKEVTVAEIYSALGDTLYSEDYCQKHAGQGSECIHVGNCGGRAMLMGLHSLVQSYLERFVLADLLEDEGAVSTRAREHIRDLSHLSPCGPCAAPCHGSVEPDQ